MSVNASNCSVSSLPLLVFCTESRTAIFIFMSYVMTYILVLFPLFFLIFYLGLQHWNKLRCSSAAATVSHSDFFTYNVGGLEMISTLGSVLYCFGAYIEGQMLQRLGVFISSITSPGQTLFHLLTCVERYLAVVHPITYLGLRQMGMVRIRNISTGCIWFLCCTLAGFSKLYSSNLSSITLSCFLVFSLILVSFCSFSVLRVLKHPGPGEVSRDREQVDQSKQRAFHTIVAIMIALLLRFVGFLVSNIMFTSSVLTHTECTVGSCAVWLTLPSSLVLPLLFLQRAGKLPGCKNRLNQNKV